MLGAHLPWELEDFLPVAEVAYSWFEAQKFGPAVRVYEALCALRPDGAYFHFMRGCSLQNAGRAEEAIAAFSRSIALDPPTAAGLSPTVIAAIQKRGELHLNANRPGEGAKDLQLAIFLDVEGKAPFAERARMLLALVPNEHRIVLVGEQP